jgi:hypothetical protein
VETAFHVDSEGMPTDLHQLLEEAVQQVNRQQPYGYRVYESSGNEDRRFYSFVPTTNRNHKGDLQIAPAFLDQQITIAPQTAPVHEIADSMAHALSAETGQQFGCCQAVIVGHLWGEQSITYQATNKPTRKVLEDLLRGTGVKASYSLRCQTMDERFGFIWVRGVEARRKPATAPASGVCSMAGSSPYCLNKSFPDLETATTTTGINHR